MAQLSTGTTPLSCFKKRTRFSASNKTILVRVAGRVEATGPTPSCFHTFVTGSGHEERLGDVAASAVAAQR